MLNRFILEADNLHAGHHTLQQIARLGEHYDNSSLTQCFC